ncbi:MAG: hypothetical protein A2294_00055 [Candidatus Magasanikbacteria bacterium RIFOXYB2_FULL_38_10]|nr:MAG: hypothetical protein A2294_00055 [Candidatus Magasanikbacteria bacterium RIFOXYB2_FULL_38_10]
MLVDLGLALRLVLHLLQQDDVVLVDDVGAILLHHLQAEHVRAQAHHAPFAGPHGVSFVQGADGDLHRHVQHQIRELDVGVALHRSLLSPRDKKVGHWPFKKLF